MKIIGLFDIRLQFGGQVRGLWHDRGSDEWFQPKSVGLKFSLWFGKWIRPVGRIYKWEFWFPKETNYNPWSSGNHWFVFRLPISLPYPFLSLSFLKSGFYIGWKIFDVNEGDEAWCKPEDMGNQYLALSFTIRRTRDK